MDVASSTLYNLPNAGAVLGVMGEYSGAFFTQFLPIVLVVLGVFIGLMILTYLAAGLKAVFTFWAIQRDVKSIGSDATDIVYRFKDIIKRL